MNPTTMCETRPDTSEPSAGSLSVPSGMSAPAAGREGPKEGILVFGQILNSLLIHLCVENGIFHQI